MNPTTLIVVTGIVVVFGEWNTPSGLQAKSIIGLFVLALMLSLIGAGDPHIANLFAIMALLGALFRYGVPFSSLGKGPAQPKTGLINA